MIYLAQQISRCWAMNRSPTYNLQKIKKILAIILLLCAFLPLSRCTTYAPPSSVSASQSEKDVKSKEPSEYKTHKDFVPIKEVQFATLKSWIYILPFLWPLPFMSVQAQAKKAWLKWTLSLLELILIAFSIYCIYFWVNMGTTLIGGYIAIICIISYLLMFLAEYSVLFFKKKSPAQH